MTLTLLPFFSVKILFHNFLREKCRAHRSLVCVPVVPINFMPTRTRQRFVRWHDDTNRRIGKYILWSRKRSASKQREKMETNDGVCIEMRQQVSRCLSWWAFLWPPFLSLSLSLSQKMEIKIWNMKQQLIGALAGAATVITIFKMFKLFWFRLPSRGLLTKSYNQGTSANGITSPFNKRLRPHSTKR